MAAHQRGQHQRESDLRAIQKTLWINVLPKIISKIRRKAGIVSTVRILQEDAGLWNEPDVLGKLVSKLIETLFSTRSDPSEEEDYLKVMEACGETSLRGTRLMYSRDVLYDPFPDITNVEQFVVQTLSKMSQERPGVLSSLIQQHLPPDKLSAFGDACNSLGIQIL